MIKTMQTPVHTIASNAGVEGAVVVGKLLEQDNPDLGYDAAKGQCSFFSFSLPCLLLSQGVSFVYNIITVSDSLVNFFFMLR